jgi:competence protein ComEC
VAADLLKVPHHGAATSSGDCFLDAVRPRVAVISVGAGNRYGHPSGEALSRLSAGGTIVFRTDLDGAVVVDFGRSTRVRAVASGREVILGALRTAGDAARAPPG